MAITNASATVTGTDTVWTDAMIGRWFTVTSTSVRGFGYWYRIESRTSGTVLTLARTYQGQTIAASATYKICETPEIPEEGHILLVDGPTADYYAGLQKDVEKATWFNNKFWTGDGNNPNRDIGNDKILGGLIGLINRYQDRDQTGLVRRQPRIYSPASKIWGVTLE